MLELFDRPLLAAVIGAAIAVVSVAASELTLGQVFGAGPVALANIVLFAVLVAGWYWRRSERLSQALEVATTELAAVTGRLNDLQVQLPGQVTRWQREAADLGKRIEAVEIERSGYENAVGAIASRAPRPVHHRLLTLVYEIGDVPEEDRATERYSTMAGDPARPLLWCDLRVDVSGVEVPRLRSFRDLLDIQASQEIEGEQFPLVPIPAGHIGSTVRALVLFEPAIDGTARDWTWSYRWPVWNPLRRTRQDRIGFEVLRTVRYDLLELHVVFPRSAVRPIMRPIEPDNRYTAAPPQRDKSDRQTIIVRLENPQPDFYSWSLRVEDFRG